MLAGHLGSDKTPVNEGLVSFSLGQTLLGQDALALFKTRGLVHRFLHWWGPLAWPAETGSPTSPKGSWIARGRRPGLGTPPVHNWGWGGNTGGLQGMSGPSHTVPIRPIRAILSSPDQGQPGRDHGRLAGQGGTTGGLQGMSGPTYLVLIGQTPAAS
uniref:Uncharacterized protein n=1 Tax=Myotis myotis TaxID=51298 RepID=A0A7J7UCW4_MYOMY|nr:hypothetical protein mMyoMyo1_008725 [Myotis myotis]